MIAVARADMAWSRECCHLRSKFSLIGVTAAPVRVKTNAKFELRWPFPISLAPVKMLLGVNLARRFFKKRGEPGDGQRMLCAGLCDSLSLYLKNWRYHSVIVSVLGADPQQMLST